MIIEHCSQDVGTKTNNNNKKKLTHKKYITNTDVLMFPYQNYILLNTCTNNKNEKVIILKNDWNKGWTYIFNTTVFSGKSIIF